MPNPHLYRESAAILAGCILSITCCTSVLAGNGPAAESVKGGDEVDVFEEVSDAAVIHDGQLLQGRIQFGVQDGRRVVNGRVIGATRSETGVEVTARDIQMHALHMKMLETHRQSAMRDGKAGAVAAAAAEAVGNPLVKDVEAIEGNAVRLTYRDLAFSEIISFDDWSDTTPREHFAAWREEASLLASTLQQGGLVVLEGDWFFATPDGMRQKAVRTWQEAAADGLSLEARHRMIRSVVQLEPVASDLARRLHGLEPLGVALPVEASEGRGAGREGDANQVPGNDDGDDHTGLFFAAYKWSNDSGEKQYRMSVSSVEGGRGQKYATAGQAQIDFNNGLGYNPPACNLLSFHQIIASNEKNYGTLLITTHGGVNTLSVEPYALNATGLAWRNARLANYLQHNVTNQPRVDATMVIAGMNRNAYDISVTGKFITTYGKMPGGLIYVGSCHGATLNDEFIAAGARVSAGNPEEVLVRAQRLKVIKTFTKMDGQRGIEHRPYAKAIEGLGLSMAGKGNTTLAPAVKEVEAPCPIEIGDEVLYRFDTACDMDSIPTILQFRVEFGDPEWVSPTELKLVCTDVSEPNRYSFRLKWNDLKGALNESRLDGNMKPRVNARGQAHDDHITHVRCADPCPTDVNDDLSTDVADVLAVISSWGDAGAGSPADANQDGTVDVVDLLAIIGGWGDECVYGACCVDGECMEEMLVEDCYDYGGDYLGDGEFCDSTLCEWGGCCIDGQVCLDAYDSWDCLSMGGIYAGDGMPCDSMTCTVTAGACCLQDGNCIDSMTESDCYDADGDFAGDGIACSEWDCYPWDTYGSCCYEDPYTGESACVEIVFESDCTAFGSGVFHLDASCYEIECDVRGACCIDEGGLSVCTDSVDRDECTAAGGEFHQLVTCDYLYGIEVCGGFPDEYGACCLSSGDCMPYGSAESCYAIGGQFAGAGVTCSELDCLPWVHVGACCIIDPMDGTAMCMESIGDDECSSMAGVFHADTACVDVECGFGGACCIELPDGSLTCIDSLDFDLCTIGNDGAFHPGMFCGEFECELLGACCIDVDNTPSCMDQVSAEDCASAGGEFSPKVTCEYVYDTGECGEFEEPFGACCVEMEGVPFCYESVDEWSCELEGGMFHLGLNCDEIGCIW
ncbi:MAG: hypothetical protein P8K80_08335 [Phycisphaerales bacterium]|nr:hypothetical protein [Phycisphaerales bacterium]